MAVFLNSLNEVIASKKNVCYLSTIGKVVHFPTDSDANLAFLKTSGFLFWNQNQRYSNGICVLSPLKDKFLTFIFMADNPFLDQVLSVFESDILLLPFILG